MFCIPVGNDEVVIVSGAGPLEETVIDSPWVAVRPPASVTWTVNELVPALVGVPVICPVAAAKLSPVGNAPKVTLQLYGMVPPVADRVAAYET